MSLISRTAKFMFSSAVFATIFVYPSKRYTKVVQLVDIHSLVGASLSEPHINGTAVRELYILYYYYATSVTRNIWPA